MTATCTREANGARSWRVLTAVLALYALVLQAVLGGAAAPSAAAPFDAHCLSQADGSGDGGQGAPQAPAHHHAGCCTLCHPATAMAPPLPAATVIAWPARSTTRLAWRIDHAPSARAPPGSIASPRAPPVV